MDDNAPKENPAPEFNKLDLSQLQGFSFGTQWSQDKSSPSERSGREDQGDRPRRDDRRDGGGPDRRDRRSFRRPAGGGPGEAGAGRPGGAGPEGREYSGDRPPRREGGGEFRGGPRRDGPGAGDRGPRQGYGGRGVPQDRGPYESPYYAVTFYPEDSSFTTLVQTIRKSCRTVELFEIARTVVAKTDRFVVVVAPKTPESAAAPAERPLLHVSVPDGIPFESDDAAIAHVMTHHLDRYFDTSEVEVDPPRGNFQVINKCGVTGELLGPPNYHRYNQIVQQHYNARVSRMPLEVFRSRIETVRDPEVVNQWLAKMKKITRYAWKLGAKARVSAEPPAAAEPSVAETVPPAAEAGADAAPAPEPATTPAAPAVPTFDSLEDARVFLLSHARDKVVRTAEHARFHGKVAETMPPGEIRRAVEGALERQRRFPLDTANALRGRLRREHFTIFKKGSKGVSYVCAVKRKFRVPGQAFSDSIGALISFLEVNPMVRASELPAKFLGLALPVAAPAEAPAAPAPAATPAGTETPAAPVAEAPKPEPTLSIEDRARISRMQGDLIWLVHEGYVTEFIDGRLFAPPPMVEARKKEIESEEHDPENFPEAPPAPAASVANAGSAAPAPETPAVPAAPVAETASVAPAPEASATEAAPASPPPAAEAPAGETPPVAPVAEVSPAPPAEPIPAPTTDAAPAPVEPAASVVVEVKAPPAEGGPSAPPV